MNAAKFSVIILVLVGGESVSATGTFRTSLFLPKWFQNPSHKLWGKDLHISLENAVVLNEATEYCDYTSSRLGPKCNLTGIDRVGKCLVSDILYFITIFIFFLKYSIFFILTAFYCARRHSPFQCSGN